MPPLPAESRRPSADPALPQQLLQALGMYCFVEQYGRSADPYSWLELGQLELNPYSKGWQAAAAAPQALVAEGVLWNWDGGCLGG